MELDWCLNRESDINLLALHIAFFLCCFWLHVLKLSAHCFWYYGVILNSLANVWTTIVRVTNSV